MKISDPKVTVNVAIQHGLSEAEYDRIVAILGRTPSYTELGIFSVMWSEHCSYKSSIAELKKLPRSGKRLLIEAGEENAGLVDIGDGLAVAFKIESHNHPSAIEPYQGAATGVGGILRDIFTMGARPVAILNSLHFGSLDFPGTSFLVKGVVKGIGDYGNSFGVPTIAGDVSFDNCYNENPLVNAMAIGIVEHSKITKAIAKGEGNLVMIVGSSTGRDGIHGATFASEEVSEHSQSKRPSVQVGDPFTEKLLLEATLEARDAGYLVGIQDMGAAGISCSTAEMSAKANSGMIIDLEHVPVREKGMTPYEIMLSESQERMLLVVKPEDADNVSRIFDKWDLKSSVIGRVTSSGRLVVKMNAATVADIPAQSLVLGGGAPVYHPESVQPAYINRLKEFDSSQLPEQPDYSDSLRKLLSSLNICSRRWIFTQYDSMVRTSTMNVLGDAGIIRLKGTKKALAFKTDSCSRYTYLHPYEGSKITVAECARNVACVGATPIAITNCLNFGNPNKPEIFWQFKEAIRGIIDACKALDTPVTGGNVSFYNESPNGSIYPTPVIGMLGEISDSSKIISASFKNDGDIILLLGETNGHIGGSEYLKIAYGQVSGKPPSLDLQKEINLQRTILDLIDRRLVCSAHDLSEGGLAVALAECCIFSVDDGNCMGAFIELQVNMRQDQFLFGEDQSRILISISRQSLDEVLSIVKSYGVPIETIGQVNGSSLRIDQCINLDVLEMFELYNSELGRKVEEAGKSNI